MKLPLLMIVVAVAGFVLGACASDKADITQEKADFQAAMSLRLNELDSRMSDLRERVGASTDTLRVELEQDVDNIAQLEQELQSSMAGIESATSEDWALVRGEIEAHYQHLDREISALAQKVDSGTSLGQMY